MKSYLITLRPLEPYFFGGERGFGYGAVKGSLKQRYFISSLDTPSQTTLLGALRYAVLAANNALINYDDGSQDRQTADALVGGESFDFSQKKSFGAIGGIHPLFILDGDDIIVPTPMNHKAKKCECHYDPMQVLDCPDGITLCGGNVYSPDYKAKDGCGGGWLNLTDKLIIPSSFDPTSKTGLFQSVVRVGINSHRSETAEIRNDDESYFKKEYKLLRRGEFAFYADIDPEHIGTLEKGVTVYLGQNKSVFALKAVERANDLEKRISDALHGCADSDFWYSPADYRMNSPYKGFMIADSRLFRYLRTGKNSSYYHRISKSKELYRLLNAGAVFYGDEADFIKDETDDIAHTIGMNNLIKITKGGQ